MQKWEYLTLASSKNYGTTKFFINGELQTALKNGNFNQIMNQLGGQGWEMVGISFDGTESTYVFKRATTKTATQPLTEKKPANVS